MRRSGLVMSLLMLSPGFGGEPPGDYLPAAQLQHVAGTVTCVARDPRPLQQALRAVSQEHGWAVDYEDPPYRSSLELVDDRSPAVRAAHPGTIVLIPRGGTFRTSYPEGGDPAAVIRRIVDDYNTSGNPGRFAVRDSSGGRLEVVGTGIKDDDGAWVDVTPVLDTPISVSGGEMRLFDALPVILMALNEKTGLQVGGGGPTNLMVQTQVRLPEGEKPAREVLRETFAQARLPLRWFLLYDAGLKSYFLNVELAHRARQDAVR